MSDARFQVPLEITAGEFIAIYKDPDGIPRAWGIGSSKLLAAGAAHRALCDYRDEKRAVSDPLANAEFTCEIKEYEVGA